MAALRAKLDTSGTNASATTNESRMWPNKSERFAGTDISGAQPELYGADSSTRMSGTKSWKLAPSPGGE